MRVHPLPLLVALGLVVRLTFLALEPSARLVGDEQTWTAWGIEIASPAVALSPVATRLIFYPPVYPYFIALLHALLGSLAAVKLAQAAFSVLLVPAVFRIAERLAGPRAAALAGALTAFWPELVWFSAHFWSETVYLVLLFWGFERFIAAHAAGARAAALLAGLLFGLAALTREPALYFVPIAGAILAWAPAPGARSRAWLFVLSATLTVAPWTLRNYVAYDAFVPVSSFGPFNLWLGNTRASREEVYAEYAKVPGRIAKYRHAQRKGVEAIWERQPAWLFEKLRDELPHLWEADSLALAHIRRGAYGPVSDTTAKAAAAIVLAPYLLLLPLFAIGLARARLGREALPLLAFFIYYNAVHVVTLGFARFRLPLLPVLFVVVAAGLLGPRLAAASTWRRSLAAVVGAILLLSVAPSLAERFSEQGYGAEEGGPKDA